jgi:hypothetical protein
MARLDAFIGWVLCTILFGFMVVLIDWTNNPAVVLTLVAIGGIGVLSLWGMLTERKNR